MSRDVVLTSPPVYRAVAETAPPGVPVFNVLDRVDPLSLLAIRERLFRDWSRTPSPLPPAATGGAGA